MFLWKLHTWRKKEREKEWVKEKERKRKGKDFILTEVFLLSQFVALMNALIICYDCGPTSKDFLRTSLSPLQLYCKLDFYSLSRDRDVNQKVQIAIWSSSLFCQGTLDFYYICI